MKTERPIDLDAIVDLAAACGYTAICLRPAQLLTMEECAARALREALAEKGLEVSLITPTVEVVANLREAGPQLMDIAGQLDLAEALSARAVRVHVPSADYIGAAQRACDAAGERNIPLLQQTHANSPFETLESAASFLQLLDRANFGLIVEPVNLLISGQRIYPGMLSAIADAPLDVHVQNVHIGAGSTSIRTNSGQQVVRHVPLGSDDGVDLNWFWRELRDLGFSGFVTVHQPELADHSWPDVARDSLCYLRDREGER